jgi:hypothetical protein
MPDEVETPLVIGARNPFSVAERKLNEKIDWQYLTPEQKQEKLKKAFNKDYKKLFDPREAKDLFVEAGDLQPCAPIVPNTWAPNPAGSSYTVTSRIFNDPLQGDLPDCYLIASLSSLAFLNMIPDKTGTSYSYTFYNPPATMGGTPVATSPVNITNIIPLDSNNNYHYSKSVTPGEIWIMMYEKAFASWVGNKSDKPDYSKICTGDPVVALLNLTGWKYSTTSRFSNKNLTASQIYDKIFAVCRWAGPYRITTRPMVAFTYDPRIEPQPGITYTDATIVGNHSYSVLGVLAPDYIVMRNPWGLKDPNPTGLPAGALASGAWYQTTDLANPYDAVFALKASVFKDYFKGFGWVYP